MNTILSNGGDESQSVGFNHVSYSPDGRLLVGAGRVPGSPGEAWVWNAMSLEVIAKLPLYKQIGGTVAVSPDGKVLATTCLSGDQIELWSTATWSRCGTLALFPENDERQPNGLWRTATTVEALTFNRDSTLLAAGAWDCRVKVWDLSTLQLREFSPTRKHNVDVVAFLGSSGTLLSATWNEMQIWTVADGQRAQRTPLGDKDTLWTSVVSDDGVSLISASDSGVLRVWALPEGGHQDIIVKAKGRAQVTAIAHSVESNVAALGYKSGQILLVDLSAQAIVKKLSIEKGAVRSLAFSRDGEKLASITMGNSNVLAVSSVRD